MSKVGDNERADMPAELVEAADKFFMAGREYRQFLKKHYPDRLHGVVWVESEDGELALYCENSYYTSRIKEISL